MVHVVYYPIRHSQIEKEPTTLRVCHFIWMQKIPQELDAWVTTFQAKAGDACLL